MSRPASPSFFIAASAPWRSANTAMTASFWAICFSFGCKFRRGRRRLRLAAWRHAFGVQGRISNLDRRLLQMDRDLGEYGSEKYLRRERNAPLHRAEFAWDVGMELLYERFSYPAARRPTADTKNVTGRGLYFGKLARMPGLAARRGLPADPARSASARPVRRKRDVR